MLRSLQCADRQLGDREPLRRIMSDEKDRLGDKLHDVDAAREDQWAHQRDDEILAKLRRKYVKAIACPQCGAKLEARVAIGVGGMACPSRHGAWADRETLDQLETRLQKAAAVRHESVGEQVFGDIVDQLSHKHPEEIDCPDCGSRPGLRSLRARQDWPGCPAPKITERGSMRICWQKFAIASMGPLAIPA